MRLLITCQYNFDWNKYFIDSNLRSKQINIKNKINLIEELKEIIKENDYVEFTKQTEDFIYIDDENWNSKKVWFIFRIFTKDYDDKKIYRGDLWVNIKEIKDFDFSLLPN